MTKAQKEQLLTLLIIQQPESEKPKERKDSVQDECWHPAYS